MGDGDVEAVQLPQGGQGGGQVRYVQHLVGDGDTLQGEKALVDKGGHGVANGMADDGGVLHPHKNTPFPGISENIFNSWLTKQNVLNTM